MKQEGSSEEKEGGLGMLERWLKVLQGYKKLIGWIISGVAFGWATFAGWWACLPFAVTWTLVVAFVGCAFLAFGFAWKAWQVSAGAALLRVLIGGLLSAASYFLWSAIPDMPERTLIKAISEGTEPSEATNHIRDVMLGTAYPGGTSYENLVQTEREQHGDDPSSQQWVGFKYDNIPSVLTPKKVVLSEKLQHASLGVYVLVRKKAEPTSWELSNKLGFSRLVREVTIDKGINCDEEMTIVAFIFVHDKQTEQSALSEEIVPLRLE